MTPCQPTDVTACHVIAHARKLAPTNSVTCMSNGPNSITLMERALVQALVYHWDMLVSSDMVESSNQKIAIQPFVVYHCPLNSLCLFAHQKYTNIALVLCVT